MSLVYDVIRLVACCVVSCVLCLLYCIVLYRVLSCCIVRCTLFVVSCELSFILILYDVLLNVYLRFVLRITYCVLCIELYCAVCTVYCVQCTFDVAQYYLLLGHLLKEEVQAITRMSPQVPNDSLHSLRPLELLDVSGAKEFAMSAMSRRSCAR